MTTPLSRYYPMLPSGLEGLIDLALDLRFSWNHEADALWKQLNQEVWHMTHNPWLVLQSVSRQTLDKLKENKEFHAAVHSLLETQKKIANSELWYARRHRESPLKNIVYFCMEFGLSEALPIYSGGLGLLAGDHLKAASELGIPLTGVGILYQSGYFRQAVDEEGNQIAMYPANNTSELPVTQVRDASGEWLRLHLPLFPGRNVWVRVWQARIGGITLYLLDTNDPLNSPMDRCISTELYGGGLEQRLQQEILLGIGGWHLLKALKIEPDVCHLNEGHAALVVLARAKSFMRAHDVTFEEALAVTRAGNLFTTHTPVKAGFDRFPRHLVERYLGTYASEGLHITLDALMELARGADEGPDAPFNMAYLAIRGSHAINGVSRLHGQVSQGLFVNLFPAWPMTEIPVGHVTNGVHVPSWESAPSLTFWNNACGHDRWDDELQGMEERIRKQSDADLWHLRMDNRHRLVNYVRSYDEQHQIGSVSPDRLQIEPLFDANILTIGFARRFATYKRPNLLLRDPDRLVRILNHPDRPVQLIIAGKAHPADRFGQDMVRAWVQFCRRPDVRQRAIYISDYDMLLAERMVQGVDVWLNNPRRPWEASGTSGMKVLVNGGLNLSVQDGWWAEAYDPAVGWSLGDGMEHAEEYNEHLDATEAEELYRLLENEVVPDFYQRDSQGIPLAWVKRMRESMARLTPFFSTNRMVREYTEKYYIPLADGYARRSQNGGRQGRDLVSWRRALNRGRGTVRFGRRIIEDLDNGQRRFSIPVYLGDVSAEHVAVQLFADNPKQAPTIINLRRHLPLLGAVNGYSYVGEVAADRPAEHYTPRVVPANPNASIPLDNSWIVWDT
ncbi:MAG: alpha-glucan family phosphorylase [Magnetococcales bacterium]|nr:alpha-glucan family phosphorylase [Magnetococcales bacterium]